VALLDGLQQPPLQHPIAHASSLPDAKQIVSVLERTKAIDPDLIVEIASTRELVFHVANVHSTVKAYFKNIDVRLARTCLVSCCACVRACVRACDVDDLPHAHLPPFLRAVQPNASSHSAPTPPPASWSHVGRIAVKRLLHAFQHRFTDTDRISLLLCGATVLVLHVRTQENGTLSFFLPMLDMEHEQELEQEPAQEHEQELAQEHEREQEHEQEHEHEHEHEREDDALMHGHAEAVVA
jgi:Hus1-like protein